MTSIAAAGGAKRAGDVFTVVAVSAGERQGHVVRVKSCFAAVRAAVKNIGVV
jgi:hypothetical protein